MSAELFATSGLINLLVALSLGILVVFKNWEERTNRIFFFMIISFSVWSFSYWRWFSTDNADLALFWVHILSIGSIFIPPLFFHWVIRLTENFNRYRWLLYVAYIVSFITFYFSFSPIYIAGILPKLFFPYWPIPGILYTVYLYFSYIFLIGISFFVLLSSYKHLTLPSKRGQLLYIILGATFGFGGGLTNFFLWYNIPIPPYGNFLVGAFPFFLGYSIVKHHLFNAKGIATEILVFFVSVALLAQTALSENPLEFVMRGLFFVAVVVFGYLIIRSVYREVETREKMELLAHELEKANARLRELDQQKSEFVSIASHQLRSPLTAIKGYSSMLLEGSFGSVPEKAREAVSRVLKSSEHLVTLVEDLLNISRIEQGRMEYTFIVTDLGKMAKDIMEALMPNAEKNKLKLSFTTDENGPYTVVADQEKLRQVVLNLIDNSIKYTPKGFVKVHIGRDVKKKTIVLSVADSGVGVTPELKDRLFEKFSRGDEKTKLHVNGTGLGLYVAREMLKAHKGDIWVESQGEGRGSTFFIELPSA